MFKKICDAIFYRSGQVQGKTARELIKELKNNKEYQEKRKQIKLVAEARSKQYKKDIQPLFENLRLTGIHIDELSKLDTRKTLLTNDVKETLVDGLVNINNAAVQSDILHVLNKGNDPIPFDALTQVFEESDDDHLRWLIADTISSVGNSSFKGWVDNILVEHGNQKFIEPLMLYVAKWFEFEDAIKILLGYMKVSPPFVLDALGQIGGARELEYLESNAREFDDDLKSQLRLAKIKIKKRLL